MFRFGPRSLAELTTCDPRLQKIVQQALAWGVMDFSVIEGHRTAARQQALFAEGKTTLDGKAALGKHNALPSLAVDLLPFPAVVNGVNVWNDPMRFHVLAGLMYAAAAQLGLKVRWGGDWNGDGNAADQTFHDLPHFEIV